MKQENLKGYKIFNPDMTCRGLHYEVGKEYKHEGEFKICASGIHFCLKASHCFNYYDFNSKNIVCEVEALGDIQTHSDDSKVATNHIKIIRQLTWEEVLSVANEGSNNTGHSNTGNWNTGDLNTGNWNTGYSNTGDRNTGYKNTGDRNTGNWNTGYSNTGYKNTGNWNTGNWNTGYKNTGNWNTGDLNTGNWNTGNRNTGYSNTGDRNTGVFCTGEKTVKFFDKDSDWTEEQFKNSKVWNLLCDVDTKLWIPDHKMTDLEKENNKGWKTAKGFYRDIAFKIAFSDKWNNWSESNKKEFLSLPNFDATIFELITGVKI